MILLPLMLAALVTPPPVDLAVTVDSSRNIVVITAGPFKIPGGYQAANTGHDHGHRLPMMRFNWPTDGWLRGASLTLTGPDGSELPRQLVHHVNVVNFARRQLIYPAVERTLAMGQETEDIRLPVGVGVPVSSRMPMGLLLAWHNEGTELEGVTLTLELEYSPANLMPRPVSVLPVYLDVTWPVASAVDFDLPPGPQEFSAEVTMPLDGRIIGAGGHLHDFGTSIRLEEMDGDEPSEVLGLKTTLADDGTLQKVERKFPGVSGRGIKLHANRRYRITGSYNNPLDETLTRGAMVHMILLFAPEDPTSWPRADDRSVLSADLEWLDAVGAVGAGHAQPHHP